MDELGLNEGLASYRYLSNSGSVMVFDVAGCRYFGFAAGDRVTNPSGKMGTVIGVRTGMLWVHFDGEKGARMLPSRSTKELRRNWSSHPLNPHQALTANELSSTKSSSASSESSSQANTNSALLSPTTSTAAEEMVTFIVERRKVCASRNKLLRNFFFRSLLTSGMKESTQKEIELGLDIRYEVFKLVVEYLEGWDGSNDSAQRILDVVSGDEMDIELLSAADMLQINDLKMSCFESILKSISPETSSERSVDIAQAGMLYGLPQLEEAALYNLQHYNDNNALLVAVQKGYHDVVISLCQRLGNTWKQKGLLLKEEFLQAVMKGFPPDSLRTLLSCSADSRKTVKSSDERGNTVLHVLLNSPIQGQLSAITADFLLGIGADPNAINIQGITPLILSAQNNRSDITRLLLSHGASPSIADRAGNTPLHVSIEHKNHSVSRVLLEDLSTPLKCLNARGRQPLSTLVVLGKAAVCEMLQSWIIDSPKFSGNCSSSSTTPSTTTPTIIIPESPKLTASTQQLPSPAAAIWARRASERVLHWLAEENCFTLLPSVIESGIVDIDCRDSQGNTLFHKASRIGSVCGIKYLLNHSSRFDLVDRRGNTGLHLAILGRSIPVVKELIQHKALNILIQNRRGNTAIHLLPLFHDDGPLISHHHQPQPPPPQQQHFHQLISLPISTTEEDESEDGNEELSQRPNPLSNSSIFPRRNSESSLFGPQPMHRRSKSDTNEQIKAEDNNSDNKTTLILQPISPRQKVQQSQCNSCCNSEIVLPDNHIEMIQLLIQLEAIKEALRIGNGMKRTLLHNASDAHCMKTIQLILGITNEQINFIDSFGRTPLHLALLMRNEQKCSCNSPLLEVVRLLISSGSDPTIQDKQGNTCLHVIAQQRNTDENVLKFVLSLFTNADNDANSSKKYQIKTIQALLDCANDSGDTPLMAAHKSNNKIAAKLFEEEHCNIQ